MWNRIKQSAGLDLSGKIIFGPAAPGFRAVPMSELAFNGPYAFTYVLTNESGEFEVGHYFIEAGGEGIRQILDSSSGTGFAADTTGLTLVVAPTVHESAAISPAEQWVGSRPGGTHTGYRVVALGSSANAGSGAVAVGGSALAGTGCTALGARAEASQASIAIGHRARGEIESIAIGDNVVARRGEIRMSPRMRGPELVYATFASERDEDLGTTFIQPSTQATIRAADGFDFLMWGVHGSDGRPGVAQIKGIVAVGPQNFQTWDSAFAKVFEVTALVMRDNMLGFTFLQGPTISVLHEGALASGITLTYSAPHLVINNGSTDPVQYAGILQCLAACGFSSTPAALAEQRYPYGAGGGGGGLGPGGPVVG